MSELSLDEREAELKRLYPIHSGGPCPTLRIGLLEIENERLRARVAELEDALRPFTEDDEHGIHRIEGWEWRQRHPRWKEDARRALGMKVEP